MHSSSRFRRAADLLGCTFLLACAPPALVRQVRLQTYTALAMLAQSELAAPLRPSPMSPLIEPGKLEAQLAEELTQPWWPDDEYRIQICLAAIKVATRYRTIFREPQDSHLAAKLPKTYFNQAEPLTAPASARSVRLYHAKRCSVSPTWNMTRRKSFCSRRRPGPPA